MKIAICSDLHLEFAPLTLENTEGIDVLILSGDILVERDLDMYDRRQIEMGFMSRRSVMWHTFFEEVSEAFPHVLYVAGNHEHYHGDFAKTLPELKRKLGHLSNVHVLDKEVFKLEDVTFVGSTLWTDMNKRDPLTLHAIRSMMNDFRCVLNSNTVVNFRDQEGKFQTRVARFSPEDAADENEKCFGYIKQIVADNDKVVVIGHHTPSRQSMHPRYSGDDLMNGGYHNSYEEYIMDHPQIKLWTHGHTHERYDYMIGETRIVCNPRGYKGYEDLADTFQLKVVEV